MAALIPELRAELRRVVLLARRTAEDGARQALQALSVDAKDPAPSMRADARALRNALRAHARHLGDAVHANGIHAMGHLVLECAYEHWHRMLFARFLAENGLLLHPEGIAVSLDEVRELAAAEKPPVDPWVLASRWATQMLPAIFRPDDPALAVDLAPEKRVALEKLLACLPTEVFTADDSLGWVYQFWQEELKDTVNQSEVKIGADELPAVTQLFTEPYMVKFLLHNTLGAWWVGRHGGEPPISMEFLRLLENGAPAAGVFPEWPDRAAHLRCLDPCCGSGHFLVEMLRILVTFRMKEEGLASAEAVDAVLRDNIYGLELDARCTQIAAFAVALEAWKLAGGYRTIPRDGLHIACSGAGPRAKKADWLRLAGEDSRLRLGLEKLYDLFREAPTLGSLIDPSRPEAGLFEAEWAELQPLLDTVLASEKRADEEQKELGISAQGIAKAAELLARRYTLVATNVPYLKRGRQDGSLREYCDSQYSDAKADLATVFVRRCLAACVPSGVVAAVTPQNWLFLESYRRLRESLLSAATWHVVARLGAGAFETIGGEVVQAALLVLSHRQPASAQVVSGLDVMALESPSDKARGLADSVIRWAEQTSLRKGPDARIVIAERDDRQLLSASVESLQGITTGDNPRFRRFFWEVLLKQGAWARIQGPPTGRSLFEGLREVLYWLDDGAALMRDPAARIQGLAARGRSGVAVAQVSSLAAGLYAGELFDMNTAVLLPRHAGDLLPLWAFCSSPDFAREVRKIDQNLKVTNATLVKVPFDRARWEGVAREKHPNGLPQPQSDDPTEWVFHGTVALSIHPMQVAVARLVGYRWPDQDSDGLDVHSDHDGIVCLPAVGGEQPGVDRLRVILAASYDKNWGPSVESQLLTSAGSSGWSLEEWLRGAFFEQHCKLFQNRPYIWHIWDGRKKDGFSALVNYHKLDRKLLEKLTYTILGDWIAQVRESQKQSEGTADARLAAALSLKERLEAILEGESPYDVFVRWKPLEQQPIGWEPDLNDGVRLNVRPFVEADVLRKRPKIKWDKDRGKNPPRAPWGEERINDRHLSLDEKRKARAKAGRR